MFNMSTSKSCDIQGTIQVRKKISGLGPVVDIHGRTWHIRGIHGGPNGGYVQATKEANLHSSYTDTSGTDVGDSFGTGINDSLFVVQTWQPYLVELIEDDSEEHY